MVERKTRKKEIDKEARKLLKEGTSKQQVYEMLVSKYNYAKDVADVLKGIPSLSRVKKYGLWNDVLLALLLIILLNSILTKVTLSIVWYLLLIYAVSQKLVKYYSWITFLSITGAFVFVIMLILTPDKVSILSIVILASILLPTCILPSWLENRLCPEPIEKKNYI